MAQAHEVLIQWTDKARMLLSDLPEIEAKAALFTLCDSVANRDV